jgi:hypothetical protein
LGFHFHGAAPDDAEAISDAEIQVSVKLIKMKCQTYNSNSVLWEALTCAFISEADSLEYSLSDGQRAMLLRQTSRFCTFPGEVHLTGYVLVRVAGYR